MTRPPRPRDPNELARRIVDLATGDAQDPDPKAEKKQRAPDVNQRAKSIVDKVTRED